ncbi:MAG TPA: hypothetical protein VL651_03305 [Bacteroidia bacterium]|nr:hypothetical protein [Bacteroidia bacterium]
MIAITWAISCVFVPATAARNVVYPWHSVAVIAWSICVFLLIFAITIPFDIRDINYDAKDLKALPHLLNINGSKILAICCLVGTIVIFFFFILGSGTVHIKTLIAYMVWSSIAALLVMGSSSRRHEYYFSFLIDGSLLLLFPLLLLACNI